MLLMLFSNIAMADRFDEIVRVNQSGRNDAGDAFYAIAASNSTLYTMVCNIGEPDCHMLAPGNYQMKSVPKERGKYTTGQNVEIDGAIYAITQASDLTPYIK